jgi:hypothetical protein
MIILLRFIQTAYDVVRRRCGGSSATPYDVVRRRTTSYDVVHVNCMLMPRSLCTVMNINEEKYGLPLAESLRCRTTSYDVVRRRTTSYDMIRRPASESTDDVVLIKTVLISA